MIIYNWLYVNTAHKIVFLGICSVKSETDHVAFVWKLGDLTVTRNDPLNGCIQFVYDIIRTHKIIVAPNAKFEDEKCSMWGALP